MFSFQYVKLIPSLSGSIYKFDGSTIEPVPMTAETLLKASFKFGDDMVMTGGKESKSYGIDFSTGKIIYECASQVRKRFYKKPVYEWFELGIRLIFMV